MAKPSKFVVQGRIQAKDDAVRMVLDQYVRSRNEVIDPKREMWEEFYEGYRNSMEIPEDETITRLALPLIYSNVEDFLSRLAVTPRIEVWGRGGPADLQRANAHRTLIDYDWQLLNMTMKMIRISKNAEVYGTAIVKTTHKKWVQKRLIRETQNVVQQLFGLALGQARRDNFVWDELAVWDDPIIEICELDHVFVDPDGQTFDPTDVRCMSWVVHETPITLDELEGMRVDGEPLYTQSVVRKLKELSKSGNAKRPSSAQRHTLREDALDLFDYRTNTPKDPWKRQFTLLEYWSNDRVIGVILEAPGLPPVRNEGNPLGFIPFMEFTPIPDLHSFYGISMPEILGSMQFELQMLHGAAIDNIMQRVHQMFTVTRTSGINVNDLRFNPSGLVWVRQHGDIRPLQREPIDFSFARESQEIDRWAQKAASTDTFSGLSAGGGTATEAQVLNQASGSKAGLMLTILSNQLLTQWGRQLMRTNELYMSDERFGRVAGDEFSQEGFKRVTPEELVSGSGMDLGVSIDLAQADPINAASKLQRAERSLQSFGAIGMPLNHPIMQATLIELARGMKLSANPEQLVFGPQAEQALAQQQAAAQAGSQPVPPGSNAETEGQLIAAESGGAPIN